MSRTWSYGLHAVAGAGVPVPEVMMGEAGRQGLCSSACVCGTRSAVRLGIWNDRSAGPTTCRPVIIDGSRIGDCDSSCAGAACSTCAWVASSCGCACAEPKSQTQTHTQSIILDSNPGLLGMSQASAKPEPALPQLASDVVMSDPGLDLDDENVREAVYSLRL